MYEVNFSYKMGPTCLIILLHARESKEKKNIFYFLWTAISLWFTLRKIPLWTTSTMYIANLKVHFFSYGVLVEYIADAPKTYQQSWIL